VISSWKSVMWLTRNLLFAYILPLVRLDDSNLRLCLPPGWIVDCCQFYIFNVFDCLLTWGQCNSEFAFICNLKNLRPVHVRYVISMPVHWSPWSLYCHRIKFCCLKILIHAYHTRIFSFNANPKLILCSIGCG
jgi:hypothetical protein